MPLVPPEHNAGRAAQHEEVEHNSSQHVQRVKPGQREIAGPEHVCAGENVVREFHRILETFDDKEAGAKQNLEVSLERLSIY